MTNITPNKQGIFCLTKQKLLAQEYFRDEWIHASNIVNSRKRGKALHQLRKRAITKYELEQLPKGAKCSTCEHYDRLPYSSNNRTHCCGLESYGGAYRIVKANDICTWYSLKETKDFK